MANRFLGLDSINVLKDYIDNKIVTNNTDVRFVTLHAYTYAEDGIIPPVPSRGSIDPNGGNIEWPVGGDDYRGVWGSLSNITSNIGNNSELEAALAKGSIWLSAGTAQGGNNFTDWSTPIKISGQNGVSVRFKYTDLPTENLTNEQLDKLSNVPLSLSGDRPKVYIWTKYGDDTWKGPTLWATWAKNGSYVVYRYCVTAEKVQPALPETDNAPQWHKSANMDLSNEYPYMWMTYKIVPTDKTESDVEWTNEPILFGHYAVDGQPGKDGVNGITPDYSVTLYKSTSSIDTPAVLAWPEDVESPTFQSILDINSEWSDVPEYLSDEVCWYIVLNINGLNNTVKNYSTIKRYSPLDGEQLKTSYVQYKYYWSDSQELPAELTDADWKYYPYSNNDTDGSLWMITTVNTVDTNSGDITENSKSDAVKITGPRGLNGTNGADGNRRNSVKYADVSDNIDIASFIRNNVYVSNSSEPVSYYINISTDEDGATGKFANIGTADITIVSDIPFVGSCIETNELILNPQDTVELIYKTINNEKKLLVIGKALQ